MPLYPGTRVSLKLRLNLGSLRQMGLQIRYTSSPTLTMRGAALTLLVLVAVWAALVFTSAPVRAPFASWVGPAHPTPELPRPWPQSLALEAARTVEGRFPPGGTLARELRKAGIANDVAHVVVTAAADVINLRRIRAGQRYLLYFGADDDLTAMRYQVDRQTAWFVARENDVWTTSRVSIPVQTRAVFISATIIDSLHRSLESSTRSAGSLQELLLRVADLYGWDIDFAYDLRRGDRLDLVIEERFVEDQFIGYGDVLAAEFQVVGRTIPVVRFADEAARVSYFTPSGESLRRTFLRSPVKYSRISSRFSARRIHPATGVARAHRGVDYVAYPGTPVQATADGVIGVAGYGSEPGRYVRIRHGGSYTSIYMHLSRIHEGIARGVEVKQGDVIGYVGKTGNATGYHLHYGLDQAGRYVDPLVVQFPAAEPVPGESWEAFAAQRDRWIQTLRDGQAKTGVRIAGGGM